MSPRFPQVSGQALIALLGKLGYQEIRQKGSHIRLKKTTPVGEHFITVPNHKTIAKGTLNDILSRVGLWNNISKEELMKLL